MRKILYASSEMLPLVKVGGLGDVASGLPRALRSAGEDIRVVLPAYSFLDRRGDRVTLGRGFTAYTTEVSGVPVYLLDHNPGGKSAFDCRDIYHGTDIWQRFARFSEGVAHLARAMDADIIHANDWHTALALVYASEKSPGIVRILTIHNPQHQGIFPASTAGKLGLKDSSPVKFRRKTNFLLAGIRAAHRFNTVSETYADEIASGLHGFGLGWQIKRHRHKFSGITNGLDSSVWDPGSDALIKKQYSRGDMDGREVCREALFREFNLDDKMPVFSMVTRVVSQKGFDILIPALKRILQKAYVIILGTGDPEYEKELAALAHKYPTLKLVFRYDEELAHRIYAGSDFFIMPSLFEPCGLGQLIAMRYGAIPIVRKTGGLADTVVDIDEGGWGLVFLDYDAKELAHTLERAVSVFNSDNMTAIRSRAMAYDSTWEEASRKYAKLYDDAMLELFDG